MAAVGALGQRLLDLIFPPRCVGCGASGAVLCARCVAVMRPLTPPICARCGRPLAPLSANASSDALCPACAAGNFPAHLAGIRVATAYEGPARAAILALKFKGQRRLAGPLGELLAAAYRREGPRAEVIVPVPLHAARQRERGYNQSALLARHCGARVGVPVRTDLLVRVRATAAQTHLSGHERRANVAGAFAATGRGSDTLAGKHILLVDDVTTTGSTLAAAADALAALHPAGIWGLAVARPDLQRAEASALSAGE